MAGGVCRAFQLAEVAICSRAAESLACSFDCAGGTSAWPAKAAWTLDSHTDTYTAHLNYVQQLNSPLVQLFGCFSEGLLQCRGELRPRRTSGGGKGCPGDQLGSAGASQVTQMLMFWQWNGVPGVYSQWENYALEMPVSVGQSLEGQLRLDFQLLAGEMNLTL